MDFIPSVNEINKLNCYIYQRRNPGEGKAWGECRRKSPIWKEIDFRMYGIWPTTHKFDWCGEFRSKVCNHAYTAVDAKSCALCGEEKQ